MIFSFNIRRLKIRFYCFGSFPRTQLANVHFGIFRQRANVVRFTGRRAAVLRVRAAESLPATLLCTVGYAMPRFVASDEPNWEAPCGGCTGRRWVSTATSKELATASHAQPVQRGWGGGGQLTEAAGRPAYRDVGRTWQGRAAKEEHGLPRTGSGADSRRHSLVRRHPAMPISGGADIMLIRRCAPLCGVLDWHGHERRVSPNSLTLC